MSGAELAIWKDPAFRRQFVESYLAITEIEPPVSREEREDMQEALELISSNELDEAVAMLEKLRTPKSSAVIDFTVANIYFQREKLGEAAAAYEAAVAKFPKFRRAWRNLGLIRVRTSEFKLAIRALTRVIELGGGDAVVYGLLGISYSNTGNSLSAETAFRMAVLLDPGTPDWKMWLARSFFKQERFADVVALTGSMIAETPDEADLWMLQASAYLGLEKPMRAAENYELVNRLGQSTVESLNMLGDIYVNEELFDVAVNSYVQAMELAAKSAGESSPARAMRAAKVLTGRGAGSASRLLIERIESIYRDQLDDEQRKELLRLRARLALAEEDGAEEVRILEEIVALDPLDGDALILLARHSSRNEDMEQAIFYYERAASIEAFEAEAKLGHAQLLARQRKFKEALPLLRRVIALNPRDDIQTYLEQIERFAK